jgi:hypothetical protein
MGPTAYALFNAMTEYVSLPRRKGDKVNIASRQYRAGRWLRSFVPEARRIDFDLDDYVVGHLAPFSSPPSAS